MSNRLASATSPYLLQHQDNPVDWHEWGDEAFAEARRREVPVLLSVGYSACHWCHVMAHESFEDEATATEMNRLFVNVKVDREERPDVDSIYMEAVQAMTGRGGWPMTVWLTPEARPFYAGTYFPATDNHGLPSFRKVMAAIASAWQDRREELVDQSTRLTEAINRTIPVGDTAPGADDLEKAYVSIASSFDGVHGGFGGAPKFPQQPVLEFLLRVRDQPFADRAEEMVTTTLSEMAAGGIHDHLAGGFSRYSVDPFWLVPHFEKMLYDNAQLARLYLWAGIEFGQEALVDVARSTLDYMGTTLRHPEGPFFSAEDADSEGVEGKFYIWTMDEVRDVVGAEDAEVAAHFFGMTEAGSFEGANVLHRPSHQPWDDRIESIRARMLDRRNHRPRPALDDKVIASWNGLAIRSFAEAGAALGRDDYVDKAIRAADFLLANVRREGMMRRAWREGRTSATGFLDDQSSVAIGLFALYAATGDERWYRAGLELVDQLEKFERPGGGYFTTGAEGDSLLKRPFEPTDNPLPSGNALAGEALLQASLYTGRAEYRSKAEDVLRSVALLAPQHPSMVAHHLAVAASIDRGLMELAIVGPEWRTLAAVYWQSFRPHVALAGAAEAGDAVPLLEGRAAADGTLAYLCRDFVCRLPTTEADELSALLASSAG